jgi:hypothetical protein
MLTKQDAALASLFFTSKIQSTRRLNLPQVQSLSPEPICVVGKPYVYAN